MYSIVERVRAHIQDPRLTTSVNAFSPRRHSLYSPTTLAVVEAAEAKRGFVYLPCVGNCKLKLVMGVLAPDIEYLDLKGDTLIGILSITFKVARW